MAQPVIRWVGGKRQLLDSILPLVPTDYDSYFEPFIGGGALFFELEPKRSVISDLNTELYELYTAIKVCPNTLVAEIQKFKFGEQEYYKMRDKDKDRVWMECGSFIDERAARTLYLNRLGFNALYRVNKKGLFNVPYGGDKRSIDLKELERLIWDAHRVLKSTYIVNSSYEHILTHVTSKDFVYFDPPYQPITKTANFTSYTAYGFNEDDQIKLRQFCDTLNQRGVRFLLSNSYSELILSEYRNYDIIPVNAKRSIAAKGSARASVKEVLVKNY